MTADNDNENRARRILTEGRRLSIILLENYQASSGSEAFEVGELIGITAVIVGVLADAVNANVPEGKVLPPEKFIMDVMEGARIITRMPKAPLQ